MPTAQILKTVVTPDDAGHVVELHISDGSPLGADQETPILLGVRVEAYDTLPLIAHLQLDALKKTMKLLGELADDIDAQILRAGPQYNVANPRRQNPKV